MITANGGTISLDISPAGLYERSTPNLGADVAPGGKILIALPHWDGDKNQAMLLARLLADTQPTHTNAADILFVHRFDSSLDNGTIQYVSRKFNVKTQRSVSREIGWPQGCNGTFFGMIDWIYRDMVSKGGKSPYKMVLVAESDCAPLYTDWIERMSKEWDRINAIKKVCIAGHLIPDGDVKRNNAHINGGSCMISTHPKFMEWMATKVAGGMRQDGGWDWLLTKKFEKIGWSHTPTIRSEWHRKSAFTMLDFQRLRGEGVVWFHGQKDNSLLDVARSMIT